MKDVILIDKPVGWTSFDVVAKIRSQIRQNYQERGLKPTKRQLRVGHAGTLDPFATGLLIVLIGDACKDADKYLKLDKSYQFVAKLGEVSSTGDPEGEITVFKTNNTQGPTEQEVRETLEQFTGVITQTPPAYSAIKVNGKRAYALAREGKQVEIPPRKVTISKIELLEYSYPYLKCVCDVSSGTYIRTLVEDIGTALGVGAYCDQLRRIKIQNFNIQNAVTVDGALVNLKAEQEEY